jgi:CDP-glycerol glycerophosphotransferase (TagB/SpsB family)
VRSALGIPTVAIMNSWDNPSTKRTVVDRPDWVLVWGPQTQAHALRYMKIPVERAVPFGAAQFEVYDRPARVTRDEFCRQHGIDPSKQILLYAGSSKGSDEFEHLRMIEAAIDDGQLKNLAVVYRPHPWGDGGYKGERLLDYPWRHVALEKSMRGYLEKVKTGSKDKFLADYADTHDVLSSVDAVVSPLSTIILEAALHGKPVLCFMPEQKEGSSFDLQKRLPHFEDLYRSPVVLVAHGETALVSKLSEVVGHIGDADFAAALRRDCNHFVAEFDKPFSQRFVRFVNDRLSR